MSDPAPPEVEAESSRPHAVAHFDPPVEDEVGSSSSSDEEDDSSSTGSTPEADENTKEASSSTSVVPAWLKGLYDEQVGWVHGKMTVRHWKPVIRSTISAWVSLLLILVPRTEKALGQASFLILIGALLSPPNEPLVAIIRRELNLVVAVCLACAWSAIGIAFADLARTPLSRNEPVVQADIFEGKYIQLAPSAILLAFLSVGSAFFLYFKTRLGPGPYVFATVFGCISLTINVTTSALFPYAYYGIFRSVIIPIATHSAISMVCSALIFPESVNAQYTKRLIAVFDPLAKALRTQPDLLKLSPFDAQFDPKPFQALINKAEAGLIPLRASAELLKRDVSYGKFSGADLKLLRDFARKLTVRCDGLSFFYLIIDPLRERFPLSRPGTPALSRATTPAPSQPGSPAGRPPLAKSDVSSGWEAARAAAAINGGNAALGLSDPTPPEHVPSPLSPLSQTESHHSQPQSQASHSNSQSFFGLGGGLSSEHKHPGHHHHSPFHHISRLHHRLHIRKPSLLHEALHHSLEQDVGLFESQRYMNIEARLTIPRGDEYIRVAVKLLGESCEDLLGGCADALDASVAWLERNNTERFARFTWFEKKEEAPVAVNPSESANANGTDGNVTEGEGNEKAKAAKKSLDIIEARDALKAVLDRFKEHDRLKILKPYVSQENQLLKEYPPHRYLFQCFVYHFHLLELAESLVDVLAAINELQENRTRSRIWWPVVPWKMFIPFVLSTKTEYEGSGPDDDDPDAVEGLEHEQTQSEGSGMKGSLNTARKRDPDAYPPSNLLELFGTTLFRIGISFSHGNLLFATKAGVLVALISLPSFLSSSASWAYKHKWIWSIIMAQLTLARFKGETAVAFVCRIIASFLGGVCGLALWYVSTGSGKGNPYGLGAAAAVFFPMLLFFRIYYPGPPITTLLTSVTIVLIIGYSYKDTHNPSPGSPGYGFEIAWKRFVAVVIGVTAAFIFSFFPPATTVRRYQRSGQATVTVELGTIFCSVISIASSQDKTRQPALVKDLVLIRSKIRKFKAQASHAAYEISLRGKWPASRYTQISNLQLQIAYLLSHLYTVVMRLDNVWVYAFLARTRLLDPEFLGSMLCTISMCASSLRNGTPLPQITAAPLLDSFMKHGNGLNITDKQESDYGLPNVVTSEVLANEQYLCFSVGVASVYGIITRLDRLTLAVKELVGENFHIDGVEIPLPLSHEHELGHSGRER